MVSCSGRYLILIVAFHLSNRNTPPSKAKVREGLIPPYTALLLTFLDSSNRLLSFFLVRTGGIFTLCIPVQTPIPKRSRYFRGIHTSPIAQVGISSRKGTPCNREREPCQYTVYRVIYLPTLPRIRPGFIVVLICPPSSRPSFFCLLPILYTVLVPYLHYVPHQCPLSCI